MRNGFSLKREINGSYFLVHGLPMGVAVCYTVRIGGYDFEAQSYDDAIARDNLVNAVVDKYQHLQEAKKNNGLLRGEESLLRELSYLLMQCEE